MSGTYSPYLSVVAVSRNDDHGGDPLRRTQIFLNALFAQSKQYGLPVEIILVEWNPPLDRPGLDEALRWEQAHGLCPVRIIRVPVTIHSRLAHSRALPLYQMIGKNVGIRRASGQFILATNIDILFSNELFAWLARRRLSPNRLYRVDRYDAANEVPEGARLADQLRFCWTHLIRVHVRDTHQRLPPPSISGAAEAGPQPAAAPASAPDLRVRCETAAPDCPPEWLHINASGDFTLLSRDTWHTLRGYPEVDAYSLHVDTLLCFMAHYGGARETVLLPPCVIFHIEHSAGSGWSPEGEQLLLRRLEQSGIPVLRYEYAAMWGQQMRARQQAILFNQDHWGLGRHAVCLLSGPSEHVSLEVLQPSETPGLQQPDSSSPSALDPRYDLAAAEAQWRRLCFLRRWDFLLRPGAWYERTAARWKRSLDKRRGRPPLTYSTESEV